MTYIVKKPFRPTGTGSKPTTVGEEFKPASAQQARLFKATGHIAEKADSVAPAVEVPRPIYSAKTAAAKTPAKTAAKSAAVGGMTRQTYQTRQMTAAKPDEAKSEESKPADTTGNADE